MAKFCPQYFEEGSEAQLQDASDNTWRPVLSHKCSFDPDQFFQVMSNLVRNPNLNSTWLFRADILFSEGTEKDVAVSEGCLLRELHFDSFAARQKLVRRLIPRNPQRDNPLDQTCLFLQSGNEGALTRSLVVYLPHLSSPEEVPFYHPAVRGIAHLHEWDPSQSRGTISLHFWHFEDEDEQAAIKLPRIALHLLSHVYKIGQGAVAGYVKRVTHDTLVPQKCLQDTQTALKAKYAKPLLDSWAEQTDPEKHVFEDICIAAFLIELWKDMYRDTPFPGFVDIGCGNGLLVYILRQEGYSGWGFDARARKSWALYNSPVSASEKTPAEIKDSLQAAVLLPSLISCKTPREALDMIHDGVFPKGTFIISNHADELTPWTPILAAHSECPFIMIPCCSHDLTGARFRAPRPRDTSKGTSTYASLVAWVTGLAAECGFEPETEMLRIPSTRNTAVVGRKWTGPVNLEAIIAKHGGADGYYDNVSKLLQSAPRGH